MSKKMCKLAKQEYWKTNFEEYVSLVKKSKYICMKCGRCSNEENRLCKSEKMKNLDLL